MPPTSGTTENAAGSTPASSGASSGSSGSLGMNISTGTASEALIKAATASSSEATPPAGTQAGDTLATGGTGQPPATSDATGQPKPAGSAGQPPATGEAPEARITAATRNARTQALTDVGQAIGMPITRESIADIREAVMLFKRVSTPEGARAFLSELAATVAKSGGKTGDITGEAESFPEADLVSPDGRYKTYSADRMAQALEINARNTRNQLLRELSPLIESVRGIQDRTATEAQTRAARVQTAEILSNARQLPGFKDHEAEIQTEMKRLGPAVLRNVGPVGLLHMAYNNIRQSVIDPKLKATLEADIRKSYSMKAAAGSGSAPMGSPGGERVKPELNNPEQLASHMERMAAAAG